MSASKAARASASGGEAGARKPLILLAAAYFLSGFCSLVYQVVWIHEFSRVFGSTVIAMSVVLAAFFGGLALGSRLFGALSARTPRPVWVYGVLEVAIGLYALAFPWLLDVAGRFYGGLIEGSVEGNAGEGVLLGLRILVAVLVLLVPTVLMGGTLPLLLRHFVNRVDLTGRRSGLVYGVNALGAAAGSFLSGYVLLEPFGYAVTNALAGGLNLALGVGALLVARGLRPTPAAASSARLEASKSLESDAAVRPSSSSVRLTVVCFALSGFVSMAYEVIWLRHLTFFFRDTIYLYTGIVTMFVFGIGAGGLLGGRLAQRVRAPVAWCGLLQLGIGVSTVGGILISTAAHPSLARFGEGAGARVFLALFGLLLVPTLCMGAAFPLVTRIVTSSARTVGDEGGRAYAWNTVGSIAGTLVAGLALFNLLGLSHGLSLLFGLNMLAAVLLLRADTAWSRRGWIALPVALGLAFPLSQQLEGLRLPDALLRQQPGVLDIREGMLGTTWVTRSAEGDLLLMENTVVISKSGRGSFVIRGFIPLIVAPELPKTYLGLAFGGGLSYYAPRQFPEVERMRFVDISRENVDAALTHFPENQGMRADPRVEFVIDDAYSALKYDTQRYDMIFVEPTPPMFSFRNAALYTREFYALGRERLSEQGVFVQILPLANLSPRETRGVMQTFAAAFETRLLWWNSADMVLIGARRPLRLERAVIERRLARQEVRAAIQLYPPAGQLLGSADRFLSGLLLRDRSFEAAARGGDVYTDDDMGLQFSTGLEVTAENYDHIAEHLASEDELGEVAPGFSLGSVTRWRRRLMAYSYSARYPLEFRDAYLDYIAKGSLDPAADLESLRSYLQGRGLHAEAAALPR